MTTSPANSTVVSGIIEATQGTPPGYVFVNTVAKIKKRFHRREIEGADKAVVLHRKIGRPSQTHFKNILKTT
jgi:hypothetical protein